VSFPTLPSLTAQPRRIDLYQKQYNHDIMVLEFSSESTLWFETLKTGVPVQFIWRQDTLNKNWIGYVSSIQKVNAPQRTNIMQIVCVGATFNMKQRATRVFPNSTIPEAVSAIAQEFGFNVITEPHPQRFSQLTIPGLSYWEWINEQAKRIGYGIIVDGLNLLFLPLDKLIDITFSTSPVLAMGNSTAPFNTQFLDRTLDKFQVIYGDNVESSTNFRTVKNVGGVDPIDGSIVLSSRAPTDDGTSLREDESSVLFSEYRTDQVINSRTDAEQISKGAAQMARFSIPATALGQGDPRVRPFGALFISGTGNITDGFWVVKEAHHMFHKVGDYMVDLKVATDGIGDQIVETPFRTRTDLAVGTVNLNEALINGGVTNLSFDLDSVELTNTNVIQNEAEQGYVNAPSKWRRVG
jgi:phage protein D